MRYLAALLSILMHALILFFLLDFVELSHDQGLERLGIELVTLAEKEQKVPVDLLAERAEFKPDSQFVSKSEQKDIISRLDSPVKRPVKSEIEKRAVLHNVSDDKGFVAKSTPAQEPIKSSPHIETGSSISPDAVVLRQGKGITVGNSTMVLKRGSEARSLSSLAAYEFGEDDFRGHYETFTGRQIVVLDARAEHGRLVLHDRKTGLLRKLKKSEHGDFIYTYGPSFDEDEPVSGTVVFLPGDEHWIHRFMWMPDGAAAEYPVKGRVDAFEADDGPERCDLFAPAAKGRFPAVVLFRYGLYISGDQFSEVARHLSGRGVVVLCADSWGVEDIQKAYASLREHPKVDPERIGLWARGYGAKKMPRIDLPAGLFKFVILTIDHPDECLFPERLVSALADGLPTFIGLRGVSGDWKRVASVMLTGFQSAPHQIVMIDEDLPDAGGKGTDQKWIDCLSGDFVNSISAWLDSN